MINRKTYIKSIYVISVLLIFINISGYFINPLNKYEKLAFENYYDKNYPVGYVYDDIDTTYLIKIYKKEISKITIKELNTEIFTTIRHSNLRRIEVYENWVMFLLGKLYEPLSKTQNPLRLIKGGIAECGEAVAILNYISNQFGWNARFIGLNGHVISEVMINQELVVVDPHYGIYFEISFDQLENATEEYVLSVLRESGYSEEIGLWYYEMLNSKEDNTVLIFGEAISPRLKLIENISEILKWIIPFALLLLVKFLKIK